MLTALEVKRLMELMSKAATELNDAEKAELTKLKQKADNAAAAGAGGGGGGEGQNGGKSQQKKEGEADDETAMSADQVKSLVTEGVKAALVGTKGADEAKVKEIVEAAVAGIKGQNIDQKALVQQITDAVQAGIKPGVSAEDVKAIVETATKGIRRDSKMQHGDGQDHELDVPIAHRAGNLTVAMKQLLNVMTKGEKAINEDIPESMLTAATRRSEISEKRLMGQFRTKGITTTGSGTGAEWMNETLSSVLLHRMYMESQLAQALARRDVQMPTNPFPYPLGTTRPTFSLTAEGADAPESQPGSGEVVLSAKKLTGNVPYSYEADEDSIIAILPETLAQLGDAAADALEDAYINGDTAATHQDSDSHALGATHSGKIFNGFRKLALAQASLKLSLASGGWSAANIGAMRKLMGRWGMNPKNLLIIAGVGGYNDAVLLPETLTAEKAGNANTARIFTGMAPSLFGIDIIPSARMREDLNASGVYDGTTTTKGSVMMVWVPGWLPGVRRGFTIETDVNKVAQKRYVIASFRRAFQPIETPGAASKTAVIGYNYNSGV